MDAISGNSKGNPHAQQPWRAEFEIAPALACEIIAEQFPQLVPVSCSILGVGWDNVAMCVNEDLVFRFPRRSLGAQLIATELKLMRAIAPLLTLPVSASTGAR